MIPLKITVRGLNKLETKLGARMKKEKKALQTAVKVEGFRVRRDLIKQVRQGAPGGRKFHPRTYMSKAWMAKWKRAPILASLVGTLRQGNIRYYVSRKDPYVLHVGWTGPQVSHSWKRLAKKHQEGFTETMDPERRASIIRSLARRGRRSIYRRYFPRKTTTRFKTPARPIIAPFWRTEKPRALRNIKRNYRLKLAGERI